MTFWTRIIERRINSILPCSPPTLTPTIAVSSNLFNRFSFPVQSPEAKPSALARKGFELNCTSSTYVGPSFLFVLGMLRHPDECFQIYAGPSGKFHTHVDTPRGALQFGSLVVCLPCKHEGRSMDARTYARMEPSRVSRDTSNGYRSQEATC